MEESPFMKKLVSSDRKERDSALDSLRTYLTSGVQLSSLDLLKLWKALFFAMWHQDRPLPQQKLAVSLADLALALPDATFVPFVRAFWQTMAREWTNIDALRMDKYLRLVRVYVRAGFEWMVRGKWASDRMAVYMDVVTNWPLSVPGEAGEGSEEMVGDGLRYHVLDVWVDELEAADADVRLAPLEAVMEPVRQLAKRGNSKVLKDRAKECAADERLQDWSSRTAKSGTSATAAAAAAASAEDDDVDGEEFSGFAGD